MILPRPPKRDPQTSRVHRAAMPVFGAALFGVLLFFLFGKVIFRGEQFAYRDAGYYHYPFAQQILRECGAGRFPLWDPYENLGVPLAGNPAAAVFYPVRAALFAAAGNRVSFGAAFKFYVLLHLAIAFAAFCYLARTPLTDREGRKSRLCGAAGTLAGALAWTFGGQVLFQVTNVPFLIGAAWLPVLVGAYLHLVIRPRFASAAAGAAASAMMITGGDPQTALFGTLLAVPLCLFCRRKTDRAGGPQSGRAAAALAGSVLLGLALAAVEIFPAAETALGSSRNRSGVRTEAERLETEMSAYHFSLPPWRTAELFWPGIGGHEFPENSRWFTALPGDRQIWTPSIYMGLIPVLAAVSALRFRRRRKGPSLSGASDSRRAVQVFFSYLAVTALLAAWGGFGLGWLIRLLKEPGTLPGAPFRPGDPAGGVYWLMTRLIPGWHAFRYPAKMMTFAALAVSLLGGIGWERFLRTRRARPGVWFLGILSLAGFLAVLYAQPARLLVKCGTDAGSLKTLYGPFLPGAAGFLAAAALAQTAVLTFLLLLLPLICRLLPAGRFRTVFPAGAGLLLLVFDLAAAQPWMTRGAPEKVFHTSSPIAAELHRRAAGRAAPPRLFRDAYLYPSEFLNETSHRRLEERVLWDRLTLFQKNAALAETANMDVRGTFVPAGYLSISRYLRSEMRRWRLSGEKGPGLDRMLAALGADALLVSAGGIRFDEVPRGGQRVHIVHRPERFAEWQDLVRHRLENEPREGESAEITQYRPDRIEIRACLTEPGTLLIAEQYWPGWRAVVFDTGTDCGVSARRVPIRCLASALRAVDLPAGRSTVLMEYRPNSVRLGAVVTLFALVLFGILAVWNLIISARTPRSFRR